MARSPSVILTPAEKKLAISNAKDAARAAEKAHAALSKDRAALDKDHTAKLKELEKNHNKAVAEATKEYNTLVKASDKALKDAGVGVTKANTDLLKFQPVQAVNVPLDGTAIRQGNDGSPESVVAQIY